MLQLYCGEKRINDNGENLREREKNITGKGSKRNAAL